MPNRFAEAIAQRLVDAAQRQTEIDPTHFDDPVAERTAWVATGSGGSSRRTRRLVEVGRGRAELRISYELLGFAGVLCAIGVGSIGVFAFERLGLPLPVNASGESVVFLYLGIGLITFGGWLLYSGTSPIVFDLSRGQFRKGRRARDGVRGDNDRRDVVPLERVHALQLLPTTTGRDRPSRKTRRYTALELNLVAEDGDRIHVLRYGGRRTHGDGRVDTEWSDVRAFFVAEAERLGKTWFGEDGRGS